MASGLISADFAQHRASEDTFRDELVCGKRIRVVCTGRSGGPDLIYTSQLYDDLPYGTVQVELANHTAANFTVQALRNAEAAGSPLINFRRGGCSRPDLVGQLQRRLAAAQDLRFRCEVLRRGEPTSAVPIAIASPQKPMPKRLATK
jgi:hypothetical protein